MPLVMSIFEKQNMDRIDFIFVYTWLEENMGYYLRELMDLRKEFIDSFREKRYADSIENGNKIIELYKNNNACNTEAYAEDVNNLAIVFDEIHINDRAKELYKEAAGLKKELSGEDSSTYLDTLTNLGVLLSTSGEFAEAEEVMKTVKGRVKENEGENSVKYVECLYNLGNMYADSGRAEKAAEVLTEALNASKRIKDYKMSDFLDIHVSIADACKRYGNYRRARDEYNKAIKISERINEKDSYFKMTYLLNAAMVCQKAERYEDASRIYEQAVEVRERLMDTKHLDFISVLNNLAVIYNLNKEHEKALEVHKRVLALIEEMLGGDHVFYGDVVTNIGVDFCAMGKYEEAIKYHNDALEIKKKIVGDKHPHYIMTLISLAEIYEKMEKYDRAIELQNMILELKRQALGEISEPIGESLMALGRIYMKKGDNPRAQGFFMQALIMNKDIIITGGIKLRGYAENIRLMAESCCNLKESGKTVQFCEKLIDYRKTDYGDRHPKYAKALYDSAELFYRLELLDKADEYLCAAEEIAETMLGNDTPFFLSCVYLRCKVLYQMKSYEKAAEKLKKASSFYKKYNGDSGDFIKIMFLQAKTEYMLGFTHKAEEIIFRAEGIASRKNIISSEEMAAEKAEFASVMELRGEHKKASELFESIYIDLDKENKDKMYKATLDWAKASAMNGEHEDAVSRADESLKYADSIDDKCVSEILASKSLISLKRLGDAEKRLESLIPMISDNSSDFVKYAAEVYCLLGESCIDDSKKSMDYFEKGLAEAKARQNIPTSEYRAFLKTASDMAAKLGRFPKAIEYLSENALIIRRDMGESAEFADILIRAAELYICQKRYSDAITMYDKAAEIYSELPDNEKYFEIVIKICDAMVKDGKYTEAAERIENMNSLGGKEKEFFDLLVSSYKGMGALGKLAKLKFGKNAGKFKK